MTEETVDHVRRIAEQEYAAARAEAAERIKNQMSIADATMKALLLANGGAMIALFTFIGNAIAKSVRAPLFSPSYLWIAFALFVSGLIVALLTHVFAFLSQDRFYMASMQELWRAQRVQISGVAEPRAGKELRAMIVGVRFYMAGLCVAIVSMARFAAGCGFALAGVLIR